MSPILQVFGTLNHRNAVFVGFFVHSKLYQNYHDVSLSEREREFTQILLLMRWDARLGFPGGMVDEGESLVEAALREVQEEIHFFRINAHLSLEEQHRQRSKFIGRLHPIVSHQIKPDLNVHFFSCELSVKERDEIRTHAHLAIHANAEVAGVNFIHCFDRSNKGFSSLLTHGFFAPGVKEELMSMIDVHNIEILRPKK
jgi:U8 snoRNA-decapping enzyme